MPELVFERNISVESSYSFFVPVVVTCGRTFFAYALVLALFSRASWPLVVYAVGMFCPCTP